MVASPSDSAGPGDRSWASRSPASWLPPARSVTRFTEGDEVHGFGAGSFADYTVAREDRLAVKPARLSFEEVAAMPVSAATALQALTDAGRVQRGQTVLVIGASGGVGSFAVHTAKALGAQVNARHDLVLDIAGNPTLTRLRHAATPTGTVVITGGEEGGSFSGGLNRQLRAAALSPVVRQRLTSFIARQRSADLERLNDQVRAGTLAPSVDEVFPLEDAADAVRRLAAGVVRGTVVLSA